MRKKAIISNYNVLALESFDKNKNKKRLNSLYIRTVVVIKVGI